MFNWNGFGVGPVELVWGLLSFAVTVIVIAAAVMLVVNLVRGSGENPIERPSEQILEERYARGEITREEFLERRSVLRGGG